MFDYATHKEFGSGDRICYHGVMDSFRNPKLAAYMYHSQQDSTPVLVLSSTMDTGDYNASRVGDAYIFTNADKVRLYRNEEYIGDSVGTEYPALPHGPIKLDVMGNRLQKEEGVTGQKAKLLRKILLAAKTYGLEEMPAKYKRLMKWCMTRYRMKKQDFERLYGEYIGNWGGAATSWRLEGIKDGKVVSSVTYGSNTQLHLQVIVSKTTLREQQSYDMAAVRIRILDVYNNPAVYAQLPVKLELEGPAELVGPDTVTAEGGMCGAYIRTVGKTGTCKLRIVTEQTEAEVVEFAVV
jgi:beta-galactosidase